MRKLIQLTLLALLASGSLMASAQGRIAVLDVQAAIMQTEQAKKTFKELQSRADYAESLKQLETLQTKFQANKEKLQKDSAVMSAEQKKAESQKIQSSVTDIQHVGKKLQAAEQELAKQLMKAFSPKLQVVVPGIIKEEGIGLLLDSKVVMHTDDSFDITTKVTAELNLLK